MTKHNKAFTDISLRHLSAYQHRAQMRLQTVVTAQIHTVYKEMYEGLRNDMEVSAGSDNQLSMSELPPVQKAIDQRSAVAHKRMVEIADRAGFESAMIATGALAKYHIRYMTGTVQESADLTEALADEALRELQRRKANNIVAGVRERVYGRRKVKFSDRLWEVSRDARTGMRDLVAMNVLNGGDTVKTSKALEKYLGHGAECPRWARSRLMQLTPTQRITDRRGLYTGTRNSPCKSVGVSYNALRLVRTETQAIHHASSDRFRESMPFVSEERIHLSPHHPPIGCACEDIVKQGRDSKGIYKVGEISLPVHPNCYCFKSAVLPDEKAFTGRLNRWLKYESSDAELMQYARWYGVDRKGLVSLNLILWSERFMSWLKDGGDDLFSRI